jgi:hypothetical protein
MDKAIKCQDFDHNKGRQILHAENGTCRAQPDNGSAVPQ